MLCGQAVWPSQCVHQQYFVVQSSVHTVCVGWFGPDLSVPTFIPDWAGYDMVHGADLFLIFVDFK